MWIRPKRVNGKRGVWATELDGTWTVFTLAGIVDRGLTEPEMRELLNKTELTLKPHKVGDRIKGDTWVIKE